MYIPSEGRHISWHPGAIEHERIETVFDLAKEQ